MSIFGAIFLFLIIWFVIVPLARVAITVHRARKRVREVFGGMGGSTDEGGNDRSDNEPPRKAKIIDPSVGEYVAYEDIIVSSEETNKNSGTTTRYTIEQQIVDAEWEDIPDKEQP